MKQWRCRECGRRFRHRNQWHSCGRFTLDEFLKKKGPRARELFEAFRLAVQKCGEAEIAPAKTMVAFRRRRNFVTVERLSNRGFTAMILLPAKAESPRFERIQAVSPWCWVHWARIESTEEIDAEVCDWIEMAWEMAAEEE